MSYGWSAGDLVLFAKIAHDIYGYYQSAPQNLQQSIEEFHYVAEQLEDLSDVLKKSGWRGYDGAPKLREDLEEAKCFFDRYASLSAATTTSTSRLFDTARLGLGPDRSKLRSIHENLKGHLEKMSAFKQHVILICSLRNLEFAQRHQAYSPSTTTNSSGLQLVGGDKQDDISVASGPGNRPSSRRLDEDNVSVISKAFSAIDLASKLKKSSSTTSVGRETRRFQPSLEPVLATSPVLDALTAATEREVIDAFIDEVVGLSEELQLYSQNPSLPQSPQQLAQITSTAMKLCDSLQSRHYGRSTSPRFNLPEIESPIESFKESIFSTLSKYSGDTSITEPSPTQPVSVETSHSFTDKATSMMNEDSHTANLIESRPRPRHGEPTSASVSQSGSKRPLSVSQSGTFIMDIGPPAKQSLAFRVWLLEARIVGAVAIECTLDFADANGNTPFCLITATAVNQRRKTRASLSDPSSLALTPQTHLNLPGTDEINHIGDSREHRRIFHHKFTSRRRPFPHILHPDVEGPGEERNAPYKITFTVAQNFEEEGGPLSQTNSTMLQYILSDEKDRDILQSLIFGKALLFSAGIKKVVTMGQKTNRCDAQQALRIWYSKNRQAKSITIYFKNQQEKLYKEYSVYGLKPGRHKLKSGTPIEIMVVEESLIGVIDSRRRSSTTSAHTISSMVSAESATSKLMTCYLYFSKDGDRAKFLRFFESSFDVERFLSAKYGLVLGPWVDTV